MVEIQKKQYGLFAFCFVLLSSTQPIAFTQTKVLFLLLISEGLLDRSISFSALYY